MSYKAGEKPPFVLLLLQLLLFQYSLVIVPPIANPTPLLWMLPHNTSAKTSHAIEFQMNPISKTTLVNPQAIKDVKPTRQQQTVSIRMKLL